ncbi:MAG: DUF1559 domain-containing protein [Planctomycetia bacterium]|nr:DUF1559 domain-containing protein [Planctomycetia bacterium]
MEEETPGKEERPELSEQEEKKVRHRYDDVPLMQSWKVTEHRRAKRHGTRSRVDDVPIEQILKVKAHRRRKRIQQLSPGVLLRRLTLLLLLVVLGIQGYYGYVQATLPSPRIDESVDNMAKILKALRGYREMHGSFPPAWFTNDRGEPTVSWRVLILPYFKDRDGYPVYDKLYKRFDLQETWEHPTNQKLIDEMPPVFLSPVSNMTYAEGRTNYLTIHHEESVFPGMEPITDVEITDPFSRTVAVVEVSDNQAVWWTQPQDFEFDPITQNGSSPELTHDGEGLVCGMCDGSVYYCRVNGDPRSLFFRPHKDDPDENYLGRAERTRLNPWNPLFLRRNGVLPPEVRRQSPDEEFDPSLYSIDPTLPETATQPKKKDPKDQTIEIVFPDGI